MFSCQNTGTETNDEIAKLESELKANPSQQTAANLIKAITSKISEVKEDKAQLKSLLDKGLNVAREYKMNSSIVSFLMPSIREFPSDENTNNNLMELANIMNSNGKNHISSVIFKSLSDKNPENEEYKLLSDKGGISSIEDRLKEMGEAIFNDPDQYGINKKSSQAYVDACEAYALANPGDNQSANYLYKAGEIARSLRTFPKALQIYDWIIEDYPNFEKAPTTLFLKGFIIENELNNEELARTTYEAFLNKYPSHDLADDVKFLVENLGKSNEEILKIIEPEN